MLASYPRHFYSLPDTAKASLLLEEYSCCTHGSPPAKFGHKLDPPPCASAFIAGDPTLRYRNHHQCEKHHDIHLRSLVFNPRKVVSTIHINMENARKRQRANTDGEAIPQDAFGPYLPPVSALRNYPVVANNAHNTFNGPIRQGYPTATQ
jgi:hypothetical protein